MKFSTNFYLERRKGHIKNVPIYLQVNYNNQRMIFTTGKHCDIDQWNFQISTIKENMITDEGDTSSSLNEYFATLNAHITSLFEEYRFKHIIPSVNELRDGLRKKIGKKSRPTRYTNFFSCFDKYIGDSTFSNVHKQNMRLTRKKLFAYNPYTTFKSVNIQYLVDFKYFLQNHGYDPQKVKSPEDFSGLSNNSVIKNFKRFHSFWTYARKNNWVKEDPFEFFRV